MAKEGKKTLVLGVGNILLQDEGVGVHAVREMMKVTWPPHVELQDGGTAAIDLVHVIEGLNKLIVIDALHAEDEPGSIYRLTPEQLQPTYKGITSLHQLGLIEVLEMAELIGRAPETVIFAIVPKQFREFSTELSPEIKSKIPRLIELVAEEIGRDASGA